MDKEGFTDLIYEVCREMPDIEVRRQFIENKFAKEGYTNEVGYRQTSFFYKELEKFKNGDKSVYEGKLIVNNEDGTFGIVNKLTCILKIYFTTFENLRSLFCPMGEPQKKEIPQRLKKILERDQAQELYKKLSDSCLIPSETPIENFYYWFGLSDKPSGLTPLVWKGETKSLLAYFVEEATDYYNLKHGEKRIIKPFEIMFDQKKLRGTINDYKKTGVLPIGHERIKALF